MVNAVLLNVRDTVVTATAAIPAAGKVDCAGLNKDIRATEDIPAYFKVSIAFTEKGGAVYKYGEFIGFATQDIREGDMVHTHNLSYKKVD